MTSNGLKQNSNNSMSIQTNLTMKWQQMWYTLVREHARDGGCSCTWLLCVYGIPCDACAYRYVCACIYRSISFSLSLSLSLCIYIYICTDRIHMCVYIYIYTLMDVYMRVQTRTPTRTMSSARPSALMDFKDMAFIHSSSQMPCSSSVALCCVQSFTDSSSRGMSKQYPLTVYIYIYTHTYTHTHTYIYIYIYISSIHNWFI